MDYRRNLLVASFLTQVAAGIGFTVRRDVLPEWGKLFRFTEAELGTVTGMGLAGFGIVIILAGLVADRVGYKALLVTALVAHLLSVAGTMLATPLYEMHGKPPTYELLRASMFLFATGSGLCVAAVNPLVATLYPDQKTHYLNILHAGWPGGMILGGLVAYMFVGRDAAVQTLRWEIPLAFCLIPVLMYGLLILREELPDGETRAAGVRLWRTVKSLFAPLFLMLIVLHAMIGFVDVGTERWITNILDGALPGRSILILVFTAGLMLVLRFFAGPIVERITPLALLLASSVLACLGLWFLGSVGTGAAVFAAATAYGLGRTFLWPTMLGVVGERFPQGGAMGMGLVAGVGMLSAGLLAGPGLATTQDLCASRYLRLHAPEAYARVRSDEARRLPFLGEVRGLDHAKVAALPAQDSQRGLVLAAGGEGARKAVRLTALVPAMMAVGFLFLIGIFYARGGYSSVRLNTEE